MGCGRIAKAALRYCTCVVLPSEADGTCYADIADALNAGNTAPFIYSGWENTIVTTGLKMLDFMKGNATMEDVIRQLDEDQDSVVNNTPDTITTVTEELSQEDCAMLVGRCFAQAAGMDEHLSKPVDIAALEQTVKRFRVFPPSPQK